jgi:hypothetical protein
VRGAGTIAKRPDGQWRLQVPIDGRQVTYGTYSTEDQAAVAVRTHQRIPRGHPQPAHTVRAVTSTYRADAISNPYGAITATPTLPPSTSITVPWTKLASSLAR